MKAHIPPAFRMTNEQKKAAQEFVDGQHEDATRRIMKLFVVALSELYGFGAGRSATLLHRVTKMAEDDDTVFWTHVDRRCEQLGFEFEKENWKEGFS